MKFAKTTLAAAIFALFTDASVQAQQATGGLAPSSPFATKKVAYDRYYPDEPASPSDAPAAKESCAPPAAPCGEEGCSEAPECVSCYSEKYDPVRVFDNNRIAKKLRWQTQGWIAQSYTGNFYNPANRFNGPVTWTDRSNDYQINEISIITGRTPDTGGCGFDWGFQSFTMFGSNARFDTSNGFEDKINKGSGYTLNAWAFPALNFQLAYNDLKITAGRFVSPVGFYTVGTVLNFFNTIPYTYQWGEPFTHTGVLAQYQITDDLNLGAGITRGWDNTGNFNPGAQWLGTVTRNNLLKEGDSLAWVGMYSNEPTAANAPTPQLLADGSTTYNGQFSFAGRYFQTLVYSRPINEKLTYIFQSDFGNQANAFGDGRAAHWFGVNQYWYYKVNNCWSWGFNFEWFRDDQGFRVGGFLPNYGNAVVGSTPTGNGSFVRGLPLTTGGFAGNFLQTTFGPRWTPNPNLVIRPNMRWDWYVGNPSTIDGVTMPYVDGTRTQQGILGIDAVVLF